MRTSFAFKRMNSEWMEALYEAPRIEEIKAGMRSLICEIAILGHPEIRRHPNIVSIQGICWDVLPSGNVWPVIVLEKSRLGDLEHFVHSKRGMPMSIHHRMKLCADVVVALGDMQSCCMITSKLLERFLKFC